MGLYCFDTVVCCILMTSEILLELLPEICKQPNKQPRDYLTSPAQCRGMGGGSKGRKATAISPHRAETKPGWFALKTLAAAGPQRLQRWCDEIHPGYLVANFSSRVHFHL